MTEPTKLTPEEQANDTAENIVKLLGMSPRAIIVKPIVIAIGKTIHNLIREAEQAAYQRGMEDGAKLLNREIGRKAGWSFDVEKVLHDCKIRTRQEEK